MAAEPRICIIGLGYVGLPLAVALAARFRVVGFDVNAVRVAELARGVDRNNEIAPAKLTGTQLEITGDAERIRGCDFYIITVPTPVDAANRPDLGAVRAACRTIGGVLSPGTIVCLESTVYPGVTEEICGPDLEAVSGMKSGRDFFLGYSPERINPGDKEHTVDCIVKVVAGQTPAVAARLAEIYGAVNGGRIFIARDIRTAEAAKVIENAQRDINIAFINEVTMIFNRIGLSVFDVLDAARTKWNFLPFTPGLVGGHCIGVDPFYLAHFAQRLHHHPEVILAGRRINDQMGGYVASTVALLMSRAGKASGGRILLLGLTFKENVPDLRNSRVVDIYRALVERGHKVDVHDPVAHADEARAEFGIELIPDLPARGTYDAVIGAVAHDAYRALTGDGLSRLLAAGGLVADVKGIWRQAVLPEGYARWQP